MSKAEHMGVSPSQVNHHAASYSYHKPTTLQKTTDFDTDHEHNDLPEHRNLVASEICGDSGQRDKDASRTSQTDQISNPKQGAVCQKLLFSADDIDSKTGIVCADSELSRKGNALDLGTKHDNPTGTNLVAYEFPENAANSSPEDLGVPHRVANNYQHGENSCNYQTLSSCKLKFPIRSDCGLLEEQKDLANELIPRKIVLALAKSSNCLPEGQSKLSQHKLKNSSREYVGGPLDNGINEQAVQHFQPADIMDEHPNPELCETPSRKIVGTSSLIQCKKSMKTSRGKYVLRSSTKSDRVPRERLGRKPRVPESNANPANANSRVERRGKKKKTEASSGADEYSKIRSHLRYLLNRMNYEQSLISAYSTDGWKGLSLEKLKPEKELQRASTEIFKRKLKIRDLFKQLDLLCQEGRLPAASFDSEGQISSEDIFCAKCGSKELTANNDIILCDGACDRGFHQLCLVPPLLKEDIPPDDEGWLCPGCVCKLDCFRILNDSQGTSVSISDNWEKVFPEAAAAAAAGQILDPNSGLPSDDSDDNDFDPDGPEVQEKSNGDENSGDESSSNESDFSSASDDLDLSPAGDQHMGLPSDDSEDDDFDPEVPDVDEKSKGESSSSDFTSDSEDLTLAAGNKISGKDETGPQENSSGQKSELDRNKRNSERLDYRKLYDETYGNIPSDSDDDDDDDDEDYDGTTDPQTPVNAKDINRSLNEVKHGSRGKTRRKSNTDNTDGPTNEHEGSQRTISSCKRAKSTYNKLGETAKQRLYQSFKENQYPDRPTKEALANELGITFKQVNKWFENARWHFYHPSSTMVVSITKNALEDSLICETREQHPNQHPDGVKTASISNEALKTASISNEARSGKVPETEAMVLESSGGFARDGHREVVLAISSRSSVASRNVKPENQESTEQKNSKDPKSRGRKRQLDE